jgi:hypothetical protein
MENKIQKVFRIIREVKELPSLQITLDNSETGKRLYDSFTERHPKLKLIRKKTIGVELVKLKDFTNEEEYIKSVNGKNSAAYFSRKAAKANYVFSEIDPNKYVDEIFTVNNSAGSRQGREMDESYTTKMTAYPIDEHNSYYGILNGKNLVAYLWIVKSGELAVLNRLLADADHMNAGVMYLLITSYISHAVKEKSETKFIMYDTFFGATDGLKMFKKRCGFVPHRVKWIKK